VYYFLLPWIMLWHMYCIGSSFLKLFLGTVQNSHVNQMGRACWKSAYHMWARRKRTTFLPKSLMRASIFRNILAGMHLNTAILLLANMPNFDLTLSKYMRIIYFYLNLSVSSMYHMQFCYHLLSCLVLNGVNWIFRNYPCSILPKWLYNSMHILLVNKLKIWMPAKENFIRSN
jgi:hypothetical protein